LETTRKKEKSTAQKDCRDAGKNPLMDQALVKNGRFPLNGAGEKGSNTAAL